MSNVRRFCLLFLASALLLASSAWAGPGGNRSGDPDIPQRGHAGLVYSDSIATPGTPGGSVGAVSERPLSAPWKVLLRMYLRFQGISIR
jgi:hypothetical protein